MTLSWAFLLLAAGLVLLVGGGELLVRGATGLATAMRISPLVIGLTVVAFGTSSPELAVSVTSAFAGQADVAVGNVIGSNIFNVLFILGVSALITPLSVSARLVRLDVPLMILASVGLWAFASSGTLGRFECAALLSGLIAYLGWTVVQSRRDAATMAEETAASGMPTWTAWSLCGQIALIVGGLALLTFGSNWLVRGAVELARFWGVSELIIGLTIVAVGTSLPEVATSILAAVRGQRDIAVGNIVGSNLFNILGILGIAGLVSRTPITVLDAAIRFDLPVMTAVAVACLPIFFTGHVIARWEGALFLGYYFAYTGWLIATAMGLGGTRTFGLVMVVFVIPLTVVTLVVSAVRAWRTEKP